MDQGVRNSDEAIEYFEKAVALDSLYYEARVRLGAAYFVQGIYGGGSLSFQRSNEILKQAVQINPNLPGAYKTLANNNFWIEADISKASMYYQMALDRGLLEPNDTQAYLSIADGRPEEAVHIGEQMLANDPLSVYNKVEFSRICVTAGAYKKQLEVSEELLAEHPKQASALRHRGESLIHLGRYEEAESIFEQLVPLNGYGAYGLAAAKFHLNKKKEAYEVLNNYRSQMSVLNIASVFMAFGEVDSALSYLERALETNHLGITVLRSSGFIQPYKDDPRFQAILGKLDPSN